MVAAFRLRSVAYACTILAWLVLAVTPAQAAEPKIAVLPLTLIDTSLEGQVEGRSAADDKRLVDARKEIASALSDSGRLRVVSNRGAAQMIADAMGRSSIYGCNGCEIAIGRRLGADYVVVGWVQKVSELILNMNVVVRSVKTGDEVAQASVSMRGNTDETWSRSARYLVNNDLLERFHPGS